MVQIYPILGTRRKLYTKKSSQCQCWYHSGRTLDYRSWDQQIKSRHPFGPGENDVQEIHHNANAGDTVVEHITTGTDSNSLNPATTWEDMKLMNENFIMMPMLVPQWWSTDPEINGINPTTTWNQDKMMYKSFITMPMLVPYHSDRAYDHWTWDQWFKSSCHFWPGENDVQIIPHNANGGTTVLENITICTENNGWKR
jgi:hypothetical protein